MFGFIIFFNLLWLQISGSKFHSKSLFLWTNFQSLCSFQGKLESLAFGSINILALDPYSSLEEEGGGRRGQVEGEKRVGCEFKIS